MKNSKINLIFNSFGKRGFFKRLILHYEKEILELYYASFTVGFIMEEVKKLVKKECPEINEKLLDWKYITFFVAFKKNLNLQNKTTNISPTPILNLDIPAKINLKNDFREKIRVDSENITTNTLEIPTDYLLKRFTKKHFDKITHHTFQQKTDINYCLPYLIYAFETYILKKENLSYADFRHLKEFKQEFLEFFMCDRNNWNFEEEEVLHQIEKVNTLIKSFQTATRYF